MRDHTDRALNTADSLGASYADARIVRRREESVSIKSARVEGVASGETEGIGIRVLVDGAWGFAATHRLDADAIDAAAGQAVRIARASATALRRPVVLDDRPPAHGRYETPVAEDPFEIPLEHKIDDLLAADSAAMRVTGIAFTESLYAAQREWKTFAATDGSFTEQVITHVGAGVEANAVAGDEHQRRSYPDAGGGWQAAGYEYVRGLDLTRHAGPYAEEAVALLTAPQCPSGRSTVILDPSQLYLQVHESCGHPTELDRVFGTEASYAGTSFLTTDKLEEGFRVRLGSRRHRGRRDRAGRLGTFGWDDEGVPAQRVPLVQNGIFVGYLSSRETAPGIGRRSGGAMRADGWNRIPLIRMTNINLLPKPGDEPRRDRRRHGRWPVPRLEQQLVDRRPAAQLPVRDARSRYEIKGGSMGRLLKNPTYTGITLRVLAIVRRGRRRASYVDAGDAQLRQGRAWPDGHVGHAVPGAASATSRSGSASGEPGPERGVHDRPRTRDGHARAR